MASLLPGLQSVVGGTDSNGSPIVKQFPSSLSAYVWDTVQAGSVTSQIHSQWSNAGTLVASLTVGGDFTITGNLNALGTNKGLVTANVFTGVGQSMLIGAQTPDGPTAVGITLKTFTNLTNATAKIVSFQTNFNVEKAFVGADGTVEVTTVGAGFVLKSPDGTRYKITVANGGALSTTPA